MSSLKRWDKVCCETCGAEMIPWRIEDDCPEPPYICSDCKEYDRLEKHFLIEHEAKIEKLEKENRNLKSALRTALIAHKIELEVIERNIQEICNT